jgi:nucleoside-diphosphate-sugar epimerase
MPARHALIAGATGIVGRRIAERLHANGWTVTGLCRRPPSRSPYEMRAVDLTDARDCSQTLSTLTTVTHLFYAARYDHPEGRPESVDVNAGMLVNVVDAIEPVARGLEHVHLVQGTKYYGHMLRPLTVPIPENAPRAGTPNFYFGQEDFIRDRQNGRHWTYTTSRPHTFCDADPAEPRNAALLIALHATLARALGRSFDFPGTQSAFHARTQFTFVPMLARAIEWMTTDARCANESFNITNGDSPSWSELWPQFAEYFGVGTGEPRPVRLADEIADNQGVWQLLVEHHDLQRVALANRVLWPYADYLFAPEWDIISSMSKARARGFGESVESARMFIDLFERFRRDKIIPWGGGET